MPNAPAPRGARRPALLAIDSGVATITLAGRQSGNRIDGPMASRLRDLCGMLRSDDAVRAIVLRAAGPDFCAGGLRPAAQPGVDTLRVAASVAALPQPVVAALKGAVAGQGLELALAADIRIAACDTRCAMGQVTDGYLPFDGGTQRLTRLTDPGVAIDMLLTGRELGATEALEVGLVSRLAAGGSLDEEAAQIAAAIAAKGGVASRYAKEAMLASGDMTLEQGLRLEADLSILLHTDLERVEGIASFLDGRPPHPGGAGR